VKRIDELRQQIDDIDAQLVSLSSVGGGALRSGTSWRPRLYQPRVKRRSSVTFNASTRAAARQ
jgi:hypothetical protein